MKTGLKGRSISIFCIVSVVLLSSCNKPDLNKLSGIQWDPNLAAPIGYADFDMNDLFSSIDSSVVTNSLGEMFLIYEEHLDTISAQSVVQLDDYSEVFDMIPPGFAVATTGSFSGVINNSTTSNSDYTTTNGVELHALNFESGSMELELSTTIQHDVTLVITILDMELNSTVIQRTLNVAYTGSVPQVTSTIVDLTDVAADFTAGGTAVNRLRISVDATITGTGQPIAGDETLDLTMNLTDMEFKNITGYFGQEVLTSVSDSILMKIFNTTSAGNLTFTNPKLTFTIDNSFGIPININFSDFVSVNTLTGQSTTISGFSPVLSVNTPTSFGQSVSTSKEFNTSNTTNLPSIIDAVPKYLQYSISATSNPAGNVLPLNFIESTSKMIVRAELELPLEGYASGIAASDTLAFSYDGNVDNVESVMFRLYAKNGFPVSFNGQAIFTDENYVPLFNLFSSPQEIVSAAAVDNAGVVSNSSSKTTDVTIDKSKVQLLGNVKHIILSGLAGTTQPGGTVVKFYDSYRIAIKLGMQVQMKTTL